MAHSPTASAATTASRWRNTRPFGLVAAITPGHPFDVPTLSGNIINMVAAGNAVVFNPHPGGGALGRTCRACLQRGHPCGPRHRKSRLHVEKPTLESFDALTKNELVRLLCVTGGPGVVSAAMKSGKRAICAGPGNPPVLVDDTCCLKKAASDIIQGARLRQQPPVHRGETGLRARVGGGQVH